MAEFHPFLAFKCPSADTHASDIKQPFPSENPVVDFSMAESELLGEAGKETIDSILGPFEDGDRCTLDQPDWSVGSLHLGDVDGPEFQELMSSFVDHMESESSQPAVTATTGTDSSSLPVVNKLFETEFPADIFLSPRPPSPQPSAEPTTELQNESASKLDYMANVAQEIESSTEQVFENKHELIAESTSGMNAEGPSSRILRVDGLECTIDLLPPDVSTDQASQNRRYRRQVRNQQRGQRDRRCLDGAVVGLRRVSALSPLQKRNIKTSQPRDTPSTDLGILSANKASPAGRTVSVSATGAAPRELTTLTLDNNLSLHELHSIESHANLQALYNMSLELSHAFRKPTSEGAGMANVAAQLTSIGRTHQPPAVPPTGASGESDNFNQLGNTNDGVDSWLRL